MQYAKVDANKFQKPIEIMKNNLKNYKDVSYPEMKGIPAKATNWRRMVDKFDKNHHRFQKFIIHFKGTS